MKKIFYKTVLAIFALSAFVACTADNYDSPKESVLPVASGLDISISVNDTNNVVTFHCDDKACVPVWIFGDKDLVAQNDVQRSYTKAGTYTVEVKAYNRNGMSDGSVIKTFTVAKDYMSPQVKAYLKSLTGGSSQIWVMDAATKGHLGCGPTGSTGLDWYSAAPNEKAAFGMYDDELTFASEGGYTYDPGADGKLFVNAGSGYKPEYLLTPGTDYDVPAQKVVTTYTFTQSGGNYYITLPVNQYLSYIPNAAALSNPQFRVLTLTDHVLELVVDDGNSIAWHYRYITKTN